MVHPDDPDHPEADEEGGERGPFLLELVPEVLPAWDADLEDEQCDRDRKDPVAEGLQAVGLHRLGVDGPAVDGAGTVEDRLRHRRMRMDDALELGVAALERHHVADLADHVAGDVAHDVGAEDLAVLGVSDDLDEAGAVVVDNRSAGAAQLELADLDLAARLLRLL